MYEDEVDKTKLDNVGVEPGAPTFGGRANGENNPNAPLLVDK